MTVFVALLRAVNVGGTGKLAMNELRSLCEQAGFEQPRTYIQSGNVVVRTRLSEAKVKAKLERELAAKMGKSVRVLVRSGPELERILERNPFEGAAPNQVLVLFLDQAPARDALQDLRIPGREQLELIGRELFIHFPDGMGRSKLKVPFTDVGTGRNLRTVTKLAALAHEQQP